MPKIEPFEKYFERYEEWFERNPFVYKSEVLAIKKLLPKKGKGIEIGVGSGRFAKPLGIKLGLDPSENMKRLAEKRGIKVIKGVAENLPFSDSSFDFVLMVTTICFLDDIETAFKETYRVLKKGGYFIIGFIDKESPIGKIYQARKNENVFYKEARFYSTKEVISYLKKANFKDFNFCQTLFRPLSEMKKIEPIKEGYGRGSFVVVRVRK